MEEQKKILEQVSLLSTQAASVHRHMCLTNISNDQFIHAQNLAVQYAGLKNLQVAICVHFLVLESCAQLAKEYLGLDVFPLIHK